MKRTFRYKARLTAGQQQRADYQLMLLRRLYNAALEQRIAAWRTHQKTLTFYDQERELTGLRAAFPEYAAMDRKLEESTLFSLHGAFRGFFRRIKAGEKPGFPRFKGRHRFKSMTYRQTGWKLEGNRLTLSGIGTFKLFLSRPYRGDIKTVTLKQDACGDWFVSLSCDNVPARIPPDTGKSIGIDLGLTSLLTTSDGEHVENPRHTEAYARRLRIAQRSMSKKKRGSTRRQKARQRVAKLHRKVERTRRDNHFKVAVDLVRRFDLIAAEDLNTKGMAQGWLAKSIHDAAWGQFIEILQCKAEEAGREVILVDPRGTSQECSGCGVRVPKKLHVRIHCCDGCGLVLDRDVNAARNILARSGAIGERCRSWGVVMTREHYGNGDRQLPDQERTAKAATEDPHE